MIRGKLDVWVLLSVTALLFFVAVNIQAGWLFILVFSVISILLSSLVMAMIWTGGNIKVERFAPAVFEGEKVEVILRITNHALTDKYLISLEDHFQTKKKLKPIFVFFPQIPKGLSVEKRYSAVASHRGVYSWSSVILNASGPAGFFQWRKKVKCEGFSIVYPSARPFLFNLEEVAAAPLPGQTGVYLGKGGEGDFFGIREYVAGDSLRGVHWPSSAKTGKLMVREMSRMHPAILCFFLDCDRQWAGEIFEEMIRLLTYAIQQSLDAGHYVKMIHHGEVIQRDRWGMLEYLASIEADSSPLTVQLSPQLPKLLQEKQLFIFTATPDRFDAAKESFARLFKDSSTRVEFVVLNTQSQMVERIP